MPAVQAFCHLFGIDNYKLSREEYLILEAEFFIRICEELKEFFREQDRNYFRLMKFSIEMENVMLDENFLRLIVKDILLTQEYTLEGIAYYTATHEDVMYEILTGQNKNPSVILFRRIIELHRLVRRDLYRDIVKKIAIDYLAAA